MKVLYWTELFWPHIGGVEVLSMHLIKALQKRGCEFAVVTSHGHLKLPDKADDLGIPVFRFSFQSALASRDMKKIRSLVRRLTVLKKKWQPDLIHINSSQPSIFFQLLSGSAWPAPVLLTIHDSPELAGKSNSLLGRMLDSASWVAAISKTVLAQARDLNPAVIPRSSLIYNGLPQPAMKPTPLPCRPGQLLCIGRLVNEKGFDLALQAMAHLHNRFPGLRMTLAGDGPARPFLERQAKDLGLGQSVDFIGWVLPETIPDAINRAAIVIVPSRFCEPFGLVALQAAQMGRPVVATAAGGLTEIVVHGKTGLLAKNEDSVSLAEQIARLLRNPDQAAQMGKNAQRRARLLFGFDRFVAGYHQLYEKLAAEVH
jgi:glycogen(starch) synthase